MSRRVSAVSGGRAGRGAGRGATVRGATVRGAGAGSAALSVAERPEVEVAVLLDLLDAACASGASVPRALVVVGAAAGGDRGAALQRAGRALLLGATWAEAWPSGDLAPVRDALRASWTEGVAASATLRAVAATLRRERRTRAMEAAGRLGVRMVIPLAVCHLPAFVLVGLVPVLVSMASAGP